MSAAPSGPTTTEVDQDRVTRTAARRGRRFGLMLAGALVTVALTGPAALAATDVPPGPTVTDFPAGPTATCAAWHWSPSDGHAWRSSPRPTCLSAR